MLPSYFPLVVLTYFTTAVSARQCIHQYHEPDLRYPPPSVTPPPPGGYGGHNFSAWIPPSASHLYGTYHITHSSQPEVQNLTNLWDERYPALPDSDDLPSGTLQILNSWSSCSTPQTTHCAHPYLIETQFGYARPIGARGPTDRKYAAAWNYTMDSEVVEQSYGSLQAVIAWGMDRSGHDYYVLYRTSYDHDPDSTWVNVLSRREEGPSNETVQGLKNGIRELGEQLQVDGWCDMAGKLRRVPNDGRRAGAMSVPCDETCVLNKGDDGRSIVPV